MRIDVDQSSCADHRTLDIFNSTDGGGPLGLLQATNGDLYGTTLTGGANNKGTAFKITPGGRLTTVYTFCSLPDCTDGAVPAAGLVQATNGDLYGTTIAGGANKACTGYLNLTGCGTVFKITLSGTLSTIYSFCSQPKCADGEGPSVGLVQAINGDLYGMTQLYGANGGGGTVFKITPAGALTTLYSFCSLSGCTDGAAPVAGLIQAANGDLYGTTPFGGAHGITNGGTVFKITLTGTLTTLYSFCSLADCADGSYPLAGLVQATNGDLYGTTNQRGANSAGTVFQITPAGSLTTIYNFCSLSKCTDGQNPSGFLIQATNGELYGTNEGGATRAGTLFEITTSGTLTTLHNFCSEANCVDGGYPNSVVQATNGDFYGTTSGPAGDIGCTPNSSEGSVTGCGTIFGLSVGLSPFVEMLPVAGLAGEPVRILGTNLTGATSVSFNGTGASFVVVSSAEIIAAVPTGATSGTVQVVTPSGAPSSNVHFGVLP